MSTLADIGQWFTTASHWSGSNGVPQRLGEHLALTAVSVAAAAVVALPAGVLLGHLRRFGFVAVSLANAARAIPTLGVLILFAVGPLGIGTRSAVAALIVFAVPPMLTNAYTGVLTVDADVRQSATGMGMTGGQVLRKVEVPLAVPLIAAGLRTASVQVVATATLAAIVGSGGLGRYIVDGYGRQDYAEVYAGVLLVAAVALLAEVTLGALERVLGRRTGRRLSGRPSPVTTEA